MAKVLYWISQLKAGCKLFDTQEDPLCLHEYLATKTSDSVDLSGFVGATKKLPARLVALRLNETQTNKNRRKIKKDAERRGTNPSKERLRLADWHIYITNIDPTQLTPKEIATVTHIRWQIELMFKCFKSVGKVNTSHRYNLYPVLCEIYAKLITQLIRHWIMIATGWRCIRYNIIKTAKLVNSFARDLTISMGKSKTAIRETLEKIKETVLISDKRIQCNGKNTTYNLLQNMQNP